MRQEFQSFWRYSEKKSAIVKRHQCLQKVLKKNPLKILVKKFTFNKVAVS